MTPAKKMLPYPNFLVVSALPENMGNLSALTHLTIEGCPELVNRCKRGTGEDWNKIPHVPDLYIRNSDDSGNVKKIPLSIS